MKKLYSVLVLLFVFAIAGNAQPFQNTFDLGTDDYANMSIVDASGNIYSVGSSNFTGAGGYDAILIKSDTSGNFVWHKQYGGSGTEFGSAIAQSYDGYAIAGRSNSFANSLDIFLVKTDVNGDLQWAKTYGTDTNDDYATYVSATNDSGFVLTGLTSSYGNGGQEVFLLKTDAAGDVEWFKTYGSNSDELGYFVQQVDDNGYVICGVSRGFGGAGMNDGYLIKTDALGNLEAQFLIGGTGDDEIRRVLFPSSDKLIVAGKTRVPNNPDDIFVGELNTQSFTFNWINTYGGNDNEGIGSIAHIPGEGYVIAGITQSFGGGQEGLVFMLDTAGAVGFSALLEGSSDEIVQDITITNNGGLITGFTNSFGGTANDIYLLTIGNSQPCFSSGVVLDVTPFSATISGPSLPNHSETTANVSANVVAVTQSNTTANQTDVCSIGQPLSADAGDDVSSCGGVPVVIGGSPTANHGTAPYTYTWSPAAGLDNPTAANPNASPISTTNYTVVVTDNVGATATSSVNVSVFSQLPAVVASATDVLCFMGNDGSATAMASGGGGGFSYNWSNGGTDSTIFGLNTGTYDVTVADVNGCEAFASVTVSEPAPITTAISATVSLGNNGTATVNASGGTPGYSYNWSTNPPQNAPTAINLAPGAYTVTVFDGNNCSATDTIDVPAALTVDPGSDQSSCGGDAVTIGGNPTADGGFPPYTYAWSPTTGLDDPTTANPKASPASSTTYSITVTDNSGATATSVVTIDVFSQKPTVTVTGTNPSCFMNNDGTAAAVASGGAGSLSLLWSNGATTDSLFGLVQGSYIVTVSDMNDCVAIDSIVLVHPNFVQTFTSSTPSSGSDGTATASAQGGTPPYTYSWNTSPPQDSSTATGLAPGTYGVTTTDSNGCTDQRTVDVPSAPSSLNANAGNDATICDTSQVQLGGNPSASGGKPPYTYAWSPSADLDDASTANPNAAPTSTTTYTLLVTDSLGATATDQVTVTVTICPGIRNIAINNSMDIFPNPANIVLNININSEGISAGLLSMIAVDGKVAFEDKLNLTNGINSISVNTSDLRSGLYFVRIKTESAISIGKAVIE